MSEIHEIRLAVPACVVLLASACSNTDVGQDIGPGSVPPPLECTTKAARAVSGEEDLPKSSPVMCPTAGDFCQCADYGGTFPDGVLKANATTTCDVDSTRCIRDQNGKLILRGCKGTPGALGLGFKRLRFAYPDCATLASVAGVVARPPEFNDEDGDYTFDLCPEQEGMRLDPLDARMFQDLRNQYNFVTGIKFDSVIPPTFHAVGTVGRMHIETLACRFFERRNTTIEGVLLPTLRPEPGNTVTAAGDWVHDIDDDHEGWAEIHEARVAATAKPLGERSNIVVLSAFFGAMTRQERQIHIQARIPIPPEVRQADPTLARHTLRCGTTSMIGAPFCDVHGTIVSALDGRVVRGSSAYGECPYVLDRRISAPAHPFSCGDSEPFCGTSDFPGTGGGECGQVDFAAVYKAEWVETPVALVAPATSQALGDLWLCDCGCDDPSAPGAAIPAAVQGCAPPNLDPASAADRALACSRACGGFMCGAAPSCRIGECRGPAPDARRQTLIGRSACDLNAPQPLARVALASDYTAVVDSSKSKITLTIGELMAKDLPVLAGNFNFNISPGTPRLLDVALVAVSPSGFSVDSRTVSDLRLFSAHRVFGLFTDEERFYLPRASVIC